MKRLASAGLLLLLLIFIIFSCAKIEFPPGGPADTVPPVVLESVPAAKQCAVPTTSEIRIAFSEKMTKSDAASALIIVPEPEQFPQLSWRQDNLIIKFADSMLANRTYVITLKTDLRDLRKNPLARPFQLAFATGPLLDTGRISGLAYLDGKPAGRIDLWAFPYEKDFDIFDRKPAYLTQTGDSGNYDLEYLADGHYLCFAVKDKARDRRFDPLDDLIGLPVSLAVIDSSYVHYSGLDFVLSKQDTASLQLLSAEFSPDLNIVVRFSGGVQVAGLKPSNFRIRNLATQAALDIGAVFAHSDTAGMIMLTCLQIPVPGDYRLEAGEVFSASGKALHTEYDTAVFSVQIDKDLAPPKLVSVIPSEGQQDFPVESGFELRFSEFIRLDSAEPAVVYLLAEDSSLVRDFKISAEQTILAIKPDSMLGAGKAYQMFINQRAIVDLNGANRLGDSTMILSFKTENKAEYGAVSGELVIAPRYVNPRVFLKSSAGRKEIPLAAGPDGRFLVEVPPGKYAFFGYDDINNNGRYDPGTIHPLNFAEPHVIFADSVAVRSRFESEGILLEMK